ncbi:hypothetical protein [Pseudoroseicyclus tamaricis]|uniref:Sulfotransferase family protein n=1 Tax=Pseudoroseicyclus tamaricis TaxID=2705421 RepID=A0A6B2JI17_9RHOB|nr:hypothetical protein [Pseudoroseicyclus tamaricis]NDV01001.1 hypothetical protein [Pseudoroseicyclus tamaricis]
MKIVLHLGAHRTGTTTFQRALAASRAPLAEAGLEVWTPAELRRGGWLSGLDGHPRDAEPAAAARATEAIRAERARLEAAGRTCLLISEENLPGTMRANLRTRSLYPDVTAWLSRLAPALEGAPLSLGLAIRPLESYWASAIASLVARNVTAPPEAKVLAAIAASRRGWRHVIGEAATALPGAAITVWPSEPFAASPADQLRLLVPEAAGALGAGDGAVHNAGAAQEARFTPDQAALLRAVDEADLSWLRGGAEARVRFVERPEDCPAPGGGAQTGQGGDPA